MQIWRGRRSHEHTTAVVPAQGWALRLPVIDTGDAHETPPLPEELGAVNGC